MKNEIIRICKGCRAKKDRLSMLKITLSDKILYLNPNSKITGRSVYVCNNKDCINKLIKTKGIKKGLKFACDSEIRKIEKKLTELLSVQA